MQQGDLRRADSGLELSGRVAEEVGQPVLRWRVAYTRANRAMAVGDFDTAERLAERGLTIGQSCGQAAAPIYHSAALAIVNCLTGRFEQALVAIEPMSEQFLPFRVALAWVNAELGRRNDAQTTLSALAKDHFAAVPRDHVWVPILAFLSRAAHQLDVSISLAGELYTLLSPYRSEVAVVPSAWVGPVAYDLGLLATALGRYDEADEHFAAAVALQERAGTRALLAQAYLEWGKGLLKRHGTGDAEQARHLLGQALANARSLGQTHVERQAGELLQDRC
jgi:tetratricopeptide (TPR) repeat protein